MKKFKFKHPSNRLLIFVLILIIGVQTALLGYLGLKTQILWDQVQCSPEESGCLGAFPILSYIRDSNNSIVKNSGVVDINATRIYFPELRIYLPFSQDARNLKYAYSSVPYSSEPTASFSTIDLQNTPIYSFNDNDVPCHQFSAGLAVNKKDSSNWQYPADAGTVKLKDGRTLYLFKNKKACGETPNKIISQLKLAQSY